MKKLIMLFAFLTLMCVSKAKAEIQFSADIAYVKTSTVDATASKPTSGKGYAIGVNFTTGACNGFVEGRDFNSGVPISSGPLLFKVFNVQGSSASGAFAYDAGQTGCNGTYMFPYPIPFFRGLNLIGDSANYQNGGLRVIWYQDPAKR